MFRCSCSRPHFQGEKFSNLFPAHRLPSICLFLAKFSQGARLPASGFPIYISIYLSDWRNECVRRGVHSYCFRLLPFLEHLLSGVRVLPCFYTSFYLCFPPPCLIVCNIAYQSTKWIDPILGDIRFVCFVGSIWRILLQRISSNIEITLDRVEAFLRLFAVEQ